MEGCTMIGDSSLIKDGSPAGRHIRVLDDTIAPNTIVIIEAFAQRLDWRNWKTALEDLHHHLLRINERDEEIKPDYANEIDFLKKNCRTSC